MKTRKIVFLLQTDMVGTDSWNFVKFTEPVTDDEIQKYGQELANNNAESYGIYPPPLDGVEEGDDTEYDDNIDCTWWDYDSNKHDGYTFNGTPQWGVA